MTELLLTLEAAVDSLESNFRPLDYMRDIFKSTPNLNNKDGAQPNGAPYTPGTIITCHSIINFMILFFTFLIKGRRTLSRPMYRWNCEVGKTSGNLKVDGWHDFANEGEGWFLLVSKVKTEFGSLRQQTVLAKHVKFNTNFVFVLFRTRFVSGRSVKGL